MLENTSFFHMKGIGQISSFQSVKCLILLFGVVRPGAYLRRGVKGGAAPAPMPYPCMDTINQLSVKIKPIAPQRKAFTRNIEVSLNFPGSERIYTLRVNLWKMRKSDQKKWYVDLWVLLIKNLFHTIKYTDLINCANKRGD